MADGVFQKYVVSGFSRTVVVRLSRTVVVRLKADTTYKWNCISH